MEFDKISPPTETETEPILVVSKERIRSNKLFAACAVALVIAVLWSVILLGVRFSSTAETNEALVQANTELQGQNVDLQERIRDLREQIEGNAESNRCYQNLTNKITEKGVELNSASLGSMLPIAGQILVYFGTAEDPDAPPPYGVPTVDDFIQSLDEVSVVAEEYQEAFNDREAWVQDGRLLPCPIDPESTPGSTTTTTTEAPETTVLEEN